MDRYNNTVNVAFNKISQQMGQFYLQGCQFLFPASVSDSSISTWRRLRFSHTQICIAATYTTPSWQCLQTTLVIQVVFIYLWRICQKKKIKSNQTESQCSCFDRYCNWNQSWSCLYFIFTEKSIKMMILHEYMVIFFMYQTSRPGASQQHHNL